VNEPGFAGIILGGDCQRGEMGCVKGNTFFCFLIIRLKAIVGKTRFPVSLSMPSTIFPLRPGSAS
jgi:hypothetical protein